MKMLYIQSDNLLGYEDWGVIEYDLTVVQSDDIARGRVCNRQ
jgi:hypothetical protein